MTGQSLSLVAALVAIVACVVLDTYGSGAAAAVLVPTLLLVAVLFVGAAALRALRRAR